MQDERKEILLGFDARENWMENHPNLHPEHSASTFTLRDGVRKVFSTDTIVWPSLFRLDRDVPAWIGMNRPFWADLDLLKTAIAQGAEPRPYWLMAATWHTDIGFSREAKEYQRLNQQVTFGPYDDPSTPPQRDPEWELLGFDVTDGCFLSGLSDCGYDAGERPALVQEWSPYLNHHHLFDDVERAFEFRSLSNGRVKEHAPFFAIGIWKVGEVR